MDKLEKALQKARTERAVHQSGVLLGAEQTTTHNRGSSKGAPPNLPAGNLAIRDEVLDQNRIVAHRSQDPRADLFRLLRTQILQTMSKHGFRTLAITSPNYGDGKTTTAINLALSIALDLKQTVLLADLDLRKPSVQKYLGIESSVGLTDYLAGTAAIPDCLLRLPFERMTLLPAGHVLERSSELLGSPQMADLAAELKSRYPDRMVIYDMPPLLAQDDPLTFLPHVDAVLLVVHDGETTTADVKRSLDILSSANVIGTVLNDQVSLFSLEKKRRR